jgi:putative phosphotransacetylase
MTFDQKTQEMIIKEVVKRLLAYEEQPFIPLGISNRHIHLCQYDLEILFGKGYQLKKLKDLIQPGQFAAEETVTIVGPSGEIKNVRILGPVRENSQVEVSLTDSYKLGISAPIRESGKTTGSPGILLKGPRGNRELKEGVIAALRHIHVPPEFAKIFQLKDKEMVDVEVGSIRKTIFTNVLIRISDQFNLEMHLDTDEANASGVNNGEIGKILKG